MTSAESSSRPRTGVLLVGHGTRDERGQREFVATVEQIAAAAPEFLVRCCYLELVEPSVDVGIERLVAEGATTIVVAPLLLFAAGHAKRDVPRAIDAARARFPQVEFVQADHLGCHERLLELSAHRFEAAKRLVDTNDGGDDAEPRRSTGGCLWIVVGRGSLDATALEEMERFARLRAARTDVTDWRVCYLAMAKPTLAEMLAEAAELPYDRVVVQPHLLFAGELLGAIRLQVAERSRQQSWRDWRLCDHLGPDRAVADAVLSRVREAAGTRVESVS